MRTDRDERSAGPLGAPRHRGVGEQMALLYRAIWRDAGPDLFEAYRYVWNRSSGACSFPGGWDKFSRAINAEPSIDVGLVRLAEDIMRRAGYETDAKQHLVGRRRWRTSGG